MARAVFCIVVISFLLMLHSSEGGIEEILVPPESQTVPLGTNVTFFCSARGLTANWVINGTPAPFSNNEDMLAQRGFTFQKKKMRISDDGDIIHNLTMTVLATTENNNTMIKCFSHIDTSTTSDNVGLTVIGYPSPVQLTVSVVNATTLQASWEQPFTFPGYEILHYNVTVENKTTGESIVDSMEIPGDGGERAVSVSSPDGEIAHECNEITFNVTATNDVGESDPTTVSGWLPIIAPGPFPSPPEIEVLFEADGTPVATITFELPYACPSQELTYTIIIEGRKDGDLIDAFTIGPKTVLYEKGRIVEESTEKQLRVDIVYEIIIVVKTFAGSGPITESELTTNSTHSSSIKDSFHTGFNPTTATTDTQGSGGTPDVEENDDWVMIAAIAAGGGGILLLVGIIIVIGVIIWKHRRNVHAKPGHGSSRRPMVSNPIYEGDVPVYETIEQAAVNFSSLPNGPLLQESPYDSQTVTPWYENDQSPQMNGKHHTGPTIPSSVTSEDNYTFMNAAGPRMKELTEEVPPRNDNTRYIQSEC